MNEDRQQIPLLQWQNGEYKRQIAEKNKFINTLRFCVLVLSFALIALLFIFIKEHINKNTIKVSTNTEHKYADATEFHNDLRNDTYQWQVYQDTKFWLSQASIPVLEPIDCVIAD